MKFNKIKLLTLLVLASSVYAEEPSISLNPLVVTATRVQENSFDLPMSIDVIQKKDIENKWTMNIAEDLYRSPGISAQYRNSYTQDNQISTRGFGARSTFGMRGIKLYLDGFNQTSSDGLSNPSHIDLATIKSIEVMRGPFSAMYGSSSGGVIQLITQDIRQKPEVGFDFKVGSFGTHEETIRSAGTVNGIQYLINTSMFNTDGFREHSYARKEQTTAKLKFNLNNDARVTILANYQDTTAREPLGLKRTGSSTTNAAGTWNEYSFLTDREKAPTITFVDDLHAHKENTQVGAKLDYDINSNNNITFASYIGHKINLNTVSLSSTSNSNRQTTAQKNYFGHDATWNNTGKIFNKDYLLTSGLSYGYFNDNRDDVNGTGTTYTGSVIRDDRATGSNFDQFVQGQVAVLSNVDVHAGVRHSNVKMKVDSNVSATQSGNVEFDKTTPVAGVLWKVNPALNLYANYGKGFETPTLIEIIYKQDPVTGAATSNGPNLDIKPMTSDNYEIGAKTFITPNTRANIAYFNTKTTNEIVIVASGSFPVYGNAAKTKRQGIEASVDSSITENLNLYGAYTYLDATFDGDYTPIGGTLVTAGNKIPGTYKQQVYGEVAWKYPALGFNTVLEGRYNSKVYVNDTNTDAAQSWTIFNVRAGFTQNISKWKLNEYVRVENIFDKDYIGSVRVNDTNSRFFEPAAGRNYLMGVSATYQF